jgi:hypothetical protein
VVRRRLFRACRSWIADTRRTPPHPRRAPWRRTNRRSTRSVPGRSHSVGRLPVAHRRSHADHAGRGCHSRGAFAVGRADRHGRCYSKRGDAALCRSDSDSRRVISVRGASRAVDAARDADLRRSRVDGTRIYVDHGWTGRGSRQITGGRDADLRRSRVDGTRGSRQITGGRDADLRRSRVDGTRIYVDHGWTGPGSTLITGGRDADLGGSRPANGNYPRVIERSGPRIARPGGRRARPLGIRADPRLAPSHHQSIAHPTTYFATRRLDRPASRVAQESGTRAWRRAQAQRRLRQTSGGRRGARRTVGSRSIG